MLPDGSSSSPAPATPKPFICADCGSRTAATTYSPQPPKSLWWVGLTVAFVGFFVYWAVFLVGAALVVAAIACFVYAGAKSYSGCDKCASRNLVPVESPRGAELDRRYGCEGRTGRVGETAPTEGKLRPALLHALTPGKSEGDGRRMQGDLARVAIANRRPFGYVQR